MPLHVNKLKSKKQRESDLNKKHLPNPNALDWLRKLVSRSKRPKQTYRWRLANNKSGKSVTANKTSAKNASNNEAPAALVRLVILLMMKNVCK